MSDLDVAIKLLSRYNLALVKGKREIVSQESGIRPLLNVLETWWYLDFSAADTIVGKAAALLYVKLGVVNLFAEVISESALSYLKSKGVPVKYYKLVPYIMNRSFDGICPMELAVKDITDPVEGYKVIKAKLEELKNK